MSVANEVQDVTGLQTVRKLISTGTGSKRSPETVEAKGKAGEEARYEEPVDAVDEAVVAFESEGGEAAPVDDTVLGRATAATQQALWDKANASDKAKSVERAHKGAIDEQRQRDLKKHHAPRADQEDQATRMNTEFDKQQAAADKESLSVQKEMDSLHKQALQEERARTIAVRDSANAFDEFKKNMGDSAKMLNVLTNAMDDFIQLEGKGITEGMDLKRLGMTAGLSGEEAFGMQVELMRGGQTKKMANASIHEAGAMANQLQDPMAQAAMLSRMQTTLGRTGNTHLMNVMPMDFLSTQPAANDLALRMVEVASELDPRDRVLLMEAAGLPSLLTYDPTAVNSNPDNLTGTRELDEDNILAAHVGRAESEVVHTQISLDSINNNEEGARLQGNKVGANEAINQYRSSSSVVGKLVKIAANVGVTAADNTLGTEPATYLSGKLTDTAAAFSPQVDEAGNVYNPSFAESMSNTPLGDVVGGAYDAVTGGIGDYFDGVSRRFDEATGNGTPSAVPSVAIGRQAREQR